MSRASELYGRPWNPREYIIVLDHYFRYKNAPRHTNASHILKVARLLGRTAASVLMRMENFASLDPEVNVKRKGLAHVNPLCYRLFEKWSQKLDALSACAQEYAREIEASRTPTLFDPELPQLPKAFDGKYELLDRIGQGGFGVVCSCVNTSNGQPYAMKVIRLDMGYDKECLNRFAREIKALKAVKHKNIIRIYEDNLENEESLPAYVMDLACHNLHEYLTEKNRACSGKRPVLPLDERCLILRSVFNAVEALHIAEPSLVHRDISPQNVLLISKDKWVLADFSLSKFLGTSSTGTSFFTQSQKAWGTPYYGAPEQYRDFRTADERADIHALGKLIWDLFSTLPPPPRPRDDLHGLPDSLAPVYFRATAYDMEGRYGSIQELRTDFEEAVTHITSNNG